MSAKAPRPNRGLTLAIYNTLEANAGTSSINDIKALLPAELVAADVTPNRKQIRSILQSGKSWGYFVVENYGKSTEKWGIASLEYYRQRQHYLANKPKNGPRTQDEFRLKGGDGNAEAPKLAAKDFLFGAACGLALGILIGLAIGSVI